MGKIVYSRHAESYGNVFGQPAWKDDTVNFLTPVGVEQATKMAKTLHRDHGYRKFDLIYTSPYTRARQTARIVASQVANSGAFVSAISPLLEELHHDPVTNERSETEDEVFVRAKQFHDHLRTVMAVNENANILVVSHAYLLRQYFKILYNENPPPHAYDVDYATPHEFRFDKYGNVYVLSNEDYAKDAGYRAFQQFGEAWMNEPHVDLFYMSPLEALKVGDWEAVNRLL